jgi:TonB family protein
VIALWLLYAVAIGLLALLAAAALERLLRLWQLPLRGVWAAAVAVTLLAPLVVRLAPAPAAEVVVGPVTAVGLDPAAAHAPSVLGPLDRLLAARDALRRTADGLARRLAPLDRPLLAAWAAASALLLLALGRSAVQLHRRRRRWERRVVDGHEVLVAPDTGPAVVGGGPIRIVLPGWALELDRPLRTMVLRHETEHLRAGDPHLLLAGVLALVATPWNAALWWQLGRLRLAVELDCDRRVLAAHGDVERYGLLLMAVGQRAGGLLRLATPALSERTRDLERRITAMTTRPPRRRLHQAVALAALAALGTAVACMVPSPNQVVGPTNAPAPQAQSVGPTAAGPAKAPNGAYFEFQIEKPATPLRNAAPVYPAALRAQGVSGQVIAQFVVDTLGVPTVSTYKVLRSDHELFTAAVRDAIAVMRFSPAQVGGRKVKQLVQQPFVFSTGGEVDAGPAVMPQLIRRPAAQAEGGAVAPSRSGTTAPPSPPPTVMDANQTYFEFQVEEPATPLDVAAPVYPATLRAQGVSGQVIAQFVVDTEGDVDVATFKVIQSSHELFTEAVRAAVAVMRFTPARVGGRAVKQLVQQPFVFNVGR